MISLNFRSFLYVSLSRVFRGLSSSCQVPQSFVLYLREIINLDKVDFHLSELNFTYDLPLLARTQTCVLWFCELEGIRKCFGRVSELSSVRRCDFDRKNSSERNLAFIRLHNLTPVILHFHHSSRSIL